MAMTPASRLLYDLVVIGSSAGGVEALATLVATLPADFPAPIVLAQHLDPQRPSHLREILGRRSTLPVWSVEDAGVQPLLPGNVYVVPADRDVELIEHALQVQVDGTRRPKPSINLLFSSAAQAYGERLVAVILTGTGSDGAMGARAVKLAGGVVLIENPATATFSSMPASLAPSTVDIVADLPQIGPLLADLVTGTYTPGVPDEAVSLHTFLEQVRQRSGVDFSTYKPPTILRRLHRRLVATGMPQLGDYLRYIDDHPDEYARLIADFLIKVTEFFRDPALFAHLGEQVLPELLAQARTQGNALRLWSAGCATGEEAYSLAILVAEALGMELEHFRVRIFATDLDAEAVAFARRGIYPSTALARVPAELRARYFTTSEGAYEVAPQIRELVIFGQHDLGQRAPFPHIDLVLCRNVLIYFTTELQKRALQLFAFALRDDGYLALGSSETTSPLAEYFVPAHAQLNLYRRQGTRVLIPMLGSKMLPPLRSSVLPRSPALAPSPSSAPSSAPSSPVAPPRAVRGTEQTEHMEERRAADETLQATTQRHRRLESSGERLAAVVLGVPVGVVVVDRHYDVQIINAAAYRLLGIYRAAVGEDLLHLAESVPTAPLRAAIDAAFQHARPAQQEHASPLASTPKVESSATAEPVVLVETALGEPRYLQLACYPYLGAPQGTALDMAPDTPQDMAQDMAQDSTHVRAPGDLQGDGNDGNDGNDGGDQPVTSVLLLVTDVTRAEEARHEAEAAVRREQRAREEAATHRQRARHQTSVREERERAEAGQQKDAEIARLRAQVEQIAGINRDLLAANHEVTAANVRLRSAHDDLLISSEEVQAGAEEIRTLNEEQQATNEELETLNEELEASVEELRTTNDDLSARTHELQLMTASLEEQRHTSERARAQLEAILLSMGDALLVVDAAGTPVLTNAAYMALFGDAHAGLAAEDDEGQPLPDAATPPQRAAGGVAFTQHFTRIAADGTRRWFEATGQPIRSVGTELGGVVTIRDITDRSLRRLQDEFLLLASHELRSPLTAQTTALHVLAKVLAPPSGTPDPASDPREARLRTGVRIALHQAERLRVLANDLLDVGRLQSGKLHLRIQSVDLGALVTQTVEAIQLTAQGRSIAVEVPQSPLLVSGDAIRLEQILSNLLNNALTYAPDSPRIEVRLREVAGAARTIEDREAELQVQDFGPGIAAADLPHLFTRFYQGAQVDGSLKTGAGLGLGLYITQQLVTAHGGSIAVTSQEGVGTTFTIRLPLRELVDVVARPRDLAGGSDTRDP